MEERNDILKEKILTTINNKEEPKWYIDVIKVAIAAKKDRQKNKDNKGLDVGVLCQLAGENRHDALYVFLSHLKAILTEANKNNQLTEKNEFRSQIAIYASDTHWLTLDVQIKKGKPTFILLDSTQLGHEQDTKKRIREIFPDAIINEMALVNVIQKDGKTCSRFMLNNLYTLQKATNIYSELEKIPLEKMESTRKITLDNMPESLYKVVRPYQSIESKDDIPEKIKTAKIKKSKQFLNGSDITLQDIFNLNIRKVDTGKGKKIFQNLYINHKKERYEAHIKEFIKNLPDDQIQKVLDDGNGWEILNKICTQYQITSPDKIFYNLEVKYSNWQLDKNICEELVAELLKTNNINGLEAMLSKNASMTKQAFNSDILFIPFDKNHSKVAKILIEHSEKIKTEINNNGETVLHLAVKNNQIDLVELIMEKLPELIIKKDYNQDTPLHVAVKKNNINLTTLFINKHPKLITQNDFDGNTVLHLAVKNGDIVLSKLIIEEMNKILTASEIDDFINHENDASETPLLLAIKNDNTELAALFLENKAKPKVQTIFDAIGGNNMKMVKVFMEHLSIIKESIPDILDDMKNEADGNVEMLKLINSIPEVQSKEVQSKQPRSATAHILKTMDIKPLPTQKRIMPTDMYDSTLNLQFEPMTEVNQEKKTSDNKDEKTTINIKK